MNRCGGERCPSTGRKSLRSYGVLRRNFELSDSMYQNFSKKTFLRFLELFLIWVSRRTTCSTLNAYARTRYVTPAWSAVTYCHFLLFSEPNFVGICMNTTLFKYVISDVETDQKIIGSIHSLRAIQVFSVCTLMSTSSQPLALLISSLYPFFI